LAREQRPNFVNAANAYNSKYHLYPGDRDYMMANMLKSWAMVESGGDRQLFLSDPFHVNAPGDWDSSKAKITDLTGPHEAINPKLSAAAALQWLRYKGTKNGVFQGNDFALNNYNGSGKIEPGSARLPNRQWYPIRITALTRAAAGPPPPQTGTSSPP